MFHKTASAGKDKHLCSQEIVCLMSVYAFNPLFVQVSSKLSNQMWCEYAHKGFNREAFFYHVVNFSFATVLAIACVLAFNVVVPSCLSELSNIQLHSTTQFVRAPVIFNI